MTEWTAAVAPKTTGGRSLRMDGLKWDFQSESSYDKYEAHRSLTVNPSFPPNMSFRVQHPATQISTNKYKWWMKSDTYYSPQI